MQNAVFGQREITLKISKKEQKITMIQLLQPLPEMSSPRRTQRTQTRALTATQKVINLILNSA